MDVLFLSPVVPWPPRSGGRVRSGELLRAVAQRETEYPVRLHVCAVEEPGAAQAEEQGRAQLGALCASWQTFPRSTAPLGLRLTGAKKERWFWSAALAAHLARLRREQGFDLLHLDEPCLLRAARPFVGHTPILAHHHKLDLEYALELPLESSAAQARQVQRVARLERQLVRATRHHVVCCTQDAQRLAARHPGIEVTAVESGVDGERVAPRSEIPRDPLRLLFLGSLDYEPNVRAVLELVGSILPRLHGERPDLRLALVGSRVSSDLRNRVELARGVELVGEVEDVAAEFARAALCLVPLRVGGGTRLKIVEALAAGCPVVSTRVGAEGLELEDGVHLALADSVPDFARVVLELCADPQRAAALAARGRERVLERYAWPPLAERLVSAWRRTVRGGDNAAWYSSSS